MAAVAAAARAGWVARPRQLLLEKFSTRCPSSRISTCWLESTRRMERDRPAASITRSACKAKASLFTASLREA